MAQQNGNTVGTEMVSLAVIDAIAEHVGVDPVELEPRLYDVIDPDALDALFPESGNDAASIRGRLVFTYRGFEVQVTSRGRVRISDTPGE